MPCRSTLSRLRLRTLVAGAVLAALTGAVVAPAAAHVTVQPGEAEAGSYAVIAFRVPNERDDARTTKVQVVLPEDQPVGSVSTTPVPGWRVTTRTRTLDEPLEVFGEEVDEVTSTITWTATGGGVAPGQFEDFELSLGPLPEAGEMVFSAIQSYSSGEEVAWNEVAVDGETEVEHPAPVLQIAPASDADSEEAADGAAPDSAAADDADDSTGTWALAVASLALLLAAVALVTALRRRGS